MTQPRLVREERVRTFTEIDLRVSGNIAMREAERCFNCGFATSATTAISSAPTCPSCTISRRREAHQLRIRKGLRPLRGGVPAQCHDARGGGPMKRVLEGSQAVAEAVRLARVQVVSAYPITPQTHIVEFLSEYCASGTMNARS
jgi:hypothetical protein